MEKHQKSEQKERDWLLHREYLTVTWQALLDVLGSLIQSPSFYGTWVIAKQLENPEIRRLLKEEKVEEKWRPFFDIELEIQQFAYFGQWRKLVREFLSMKEYNIKLQKGGVILPNAFSGKKMLLVVDHDQTNLSGMDWVPLNYICTGNDFNLYENYSEDRMANSCCRSVIRWNNCYFIFHISGATAMLLDETKLSSMDILKKLLEYDSVVKDEPWSYNSFINWLDWMEFAIAKNPL